MSAGLKPYSAYKDAGAAWLGNVPEHWEVLPLYAVAKPKSITGRQDRELLSVYLDRGVIRFSEVEEKRTNVTSEDLSKYQAVDPGDFVLNNQQAWRGSVGVSAHTGIVSPAYLVLSLDSRLQPEFANLLLREKVMVSQYLVCSRGVGSIQRNLYWPHLKRASTWLPSPQEQSTIVRYLDYMERRIRRYIRAKQTLIKLLGEQKRAMIERVVAGKVDPRTGGPYNAYRDSGIDWLGEVPENWRVVKLKSLVSRVTSGSRGWSDFAADSGVLFIRVGNLTRASIGLKLGDVVRLRLPDSVLSGEATRTRVQAHDILLSITAYIGSVAVVPEDLEEAYVSQHVACCRPKAAAADPKWVAYVLLSSIGQTHGQLSMYGGTKQGLSLDDVKNYIVVLPPADEQPLLVERIEKACSRVDTAIIEARQAVALLREYRVRLITDVVTGELDVREAVANLPDEDDEPELREGGSLITVGDEAGELVDQEAVLEDVEV